MTKFEGVIIEESLASKDVLKMVTVLSTKVEQVTDQHKTPWVTQWTLHTVEVSDENSEKVAKILSLALDHEHPWYADFKNDALHYIVFQNKVFRIDRHSKAQYDEASRYGVSLGIPDYQVDFHPDAAEWNR